MNLKTAIIVVSTIVLQSIIGSSAVEIVQQSSSSSATPTTTTITTKTTTRGIGERLVNITRKYRTTTKKGLKISKENFNSNSTDDFSTDEEGEDSSDLNIVVQPPVVAPSSTNDIPLRRFLEEHTITLFGLNHSVPFTADEIVFLSDAMRDAMNEVHQDDDIYTRAAVITKEELDDEYYTAKHRRQGNDGSRKLRGDNHHILNPIHSNSTTINGNDNNNSNDDDTHNKYSSDQPVERRRQLFDESIDQRDNFDFWILIDFVCLHCPYDYSTRTRSPTKAPVKDATCVLCTSDVSVRATRPPTKAPTKVPTKVPTKAPVKPLSNIAIEPKTLETTFCSKVTSSTFPRLSQTTGCAIN
jgi:hypothetical protein